MKKINVVILDKNDFKKEINLKNGIKSEDLIAITGKGTYFEILNADIVYYFDNNVYHEIKNRCGLNLN